MRWKGQVLHAMSSYSSQHKKQTILEVNSMDLHNVVHFDVWTSIQLSIDRDEIIIYLWFEVLWLLIIGYFKFYDSRKSDFMINNSS